jgi:hypothetical protein
MNLSSGAVPDSDDETIAVQRTKTKNARKKAKRAAKRLIMIAQLQAQAVVDNPSAACVAAADAAHPQADAGAIRASTSSASATASADAVVEMTEVQKFKDALESAAAASEDPEERLDQPYIDDLVRRLDKFGVERTSETVVRDPIFSRSRLAALIAALDPSRAEDAELRLTVENMLQLYERYRPYFLSE